MSDSRKYLPNLISASRIVITPVIIILMFKGSLAASLIALLLFIAAAISDYWDGKLARELGVGSRLGKFLDPLADKVLILGTLIALAVLLPDVVPWWAVALIALRDVFVTVQRSVAESRGRSVRTLPMAKTKTTFQLIFLIGMLVVLAAEMLPDPLSSIATWVLQSPIPLILLLIVVAITVFTGVMYAMNPTHPTEQQGS